MNNIAYKGTFYNIPCKIDSEGNMVIGEKGKEYNLDMSEYCKEKNMSYKNKTGDYLSCGWGVEEYLDSQQEKDYAVPFNLGFEPFVFIPENIFKLDEVPAFADLKYIDLNGNLNPIKEDGSISSDASSNNKLKSVVVEGKVNLKGNASMLFVGSYAYGYPNGCRTPFASVESMDLRNFDVSQVTDMSCMFASCENLKHLDISTWDTRNVKKMSGMFSMYNENIDIKGPYNLAKTTEPYTMERYILKPISDNIKLEEAKKKYDKALSNSADMFETQTDDVFEQEESDGIIIE